MFINYSNHPSKEWGEKQLQAAMQYGPILDIPFPSISPELTEEEMDRLAARQAQLILSYGSPTVMVQGEAVFSFRLVTILKSRGLTVLAACSNREATVCTLADGTAVKESAFRFVRFFPY